VAAPPPVDPAVRKRAEALGSAFGLSDADAEILARDPSVEAFFRAAVAAHDDPAGIANWIINILPPIADGRAVSQLRFGPEALAGVVSLVDRDVISARGGAAVLEVLAREGGDPEEIVRRLDLAQMSDPEELARMVEQVLADHPAKVQEYRSGKSGLAGFFMGRVMEKSSGRADPKLTRKLLEDALK
jgi:aspartyl-tRNA(Asn)/glutamyl-tRNA(Gln) amidotransferase subunit B